MDAGTVTGIGMDAVTVVSDTISTLGDSYGTAIVT